MHPLPMHSQAAPAAEAAMAAHAQGKFKEMHEKLMANSGNLTRDKLLELAKEVGLDLDRFTKDLDTNAHKAEIDLETKEAMNIGGPWRETRGAHERARAAFERDVGRRPGLPLSSRPR